ncbi:hypothetical protein V5P93_001602 [Actinokineospora auranticolor]|uniref:Uncharacterized protein n=1 Tax=Actinokineospora auranticolor TaxID=155976 RepID=A0A2S6GBG4_9PSEU|nr:hypothetical protein [Actinokineospora auranticolor]PPK61087.1 hypothetical protein CLV40_1449 [Actinokineospora auranticolor]
MTATGARPVPDPIADRPAAEDPITAELLDLAAAMANRLRLVGYVACAALVLSAVPTVINLSTGDLGGAAPWALLVLSQAVLLWYAYRPAGHRSWAAAAAVAMDRSPWRPVRARLVRAGRLSAVVEVADGAGFAPVRVLLFTRAHQVMVNRVGTVWLVGPERGWSFLRVAGSHSFFPARPLRHSPGGTPVAAVEEHEVTRGVARTLRSLTLLPTLQIPLMVPVSYLASIPIGALDWWPIAATSTALAVVGVLVPLRLKWGNVRLPAMVDDGPWVRVPAHVTPWRVRPDGTATATVALHFDDGAKRTATLPAAGVDVLGAIWSTGSLWFIGSPDPGKTVAAGFPGCPLLAFAKIGPDR